MERPPKPGLEVIPAIDLREGRCVRLVQGDFTRETVFAHDPVAVALRWQELGAPRLHVVDLDGSRAGEPRETDAIERIVAAVSIPVQVAGGIRRLEHAHRYMRAGADRVVFGTAAVRDPNLIVEALAMDAGAVVVAIDVRDGHVRVQGWQDETALSPLALARQMAALGVRRVLSTDIARDGTLGEPGFDGLAALCGATDLAVIASGGVTTAAHLRRLAAIGVEGAIIGRALYTGDLSLADALAAASA